VRKVFTVRAVWDKEANVYCSESDIDGLHIEADTLEEFENELFDIAADLIFANHMTDDELASSPPKDIIPAILYKGTLEKVA
jgi:hypothetical protein